MKKPFDQPEAGDRIEIRINNVFERGILLDSHDQGVLLLKLDNGYNVGLKKEDISEINVLEKAKMKKEEKGELKVSGKKPIIDFILTGGTISSKLDPETGGVKDLTEPKEFFKAYL